MEHHNGHPKPPMQNHSKHATHTMPDGTVMPGVMPGSHAGHGGGHNHSAMITDFLRRFWVCLTLTVPVVAISPMFQMVSGISSTFQGAMGCRLCSVASFIFMAAGRSSPGFGTKCAVGNQA